MKKKVLFYALMPSDPTSFYRASGVLPYIRSSEFEIIDASFTTNFNWASFVGIDVLILQRPFTREHVQLLTLARDMGVKTICDYDDDLLTVDMHNPTYHQYQAAQDAVRECVSLSDEVWVSTPGIGSSLTHQNIHIIPNAHNDYLHPIRSKRAFKANKKVFWRGGQSHAADVMEVADMLVRVINENKDWKFMFMGDRFTYIEQRTGDNHEIIGGMTPIQYFKYLHFENPSVMIFPLCNTKFNQGKSCISFLEGTYAGAAFYGRTGLPEFNKKGVLDFYDHLDLEEETLRYHNKISWELITDTLLLSNINETRKTRLLELCQ